MSVMQVRRIKTVLELQQQADTMHSTSATLLLLAQTSGQATSFITTASSSAEVKGLPLSEGSESSTGADIGRHPCSQ